MTVRNFGNYIRLRSNLIVFFSRDNQIWITKRICVVIFSIPSAIRLFLLKRKTRKKEKDGQYIRNMNAVCVHSYELSVV